MIKILLSGIILLLASETLAHGPAEWIAKEGIKNRAGELCCGEQDCGYKVSGTIELKSDGYHVKASFRVHPPALYDGATVEPFLIEVDEIIPEHDATPSPTGDYWYCKWGGTRKCFFAPPPGA